jgi:hypothetical protein
MIDRHLPFRQEVDRIGRFLDATCPDRPRGVSRDPEDLLQHAAIAMPMVASSSWMRR